MIEKKKFRDYDSKDKADIVPLRFNSQERRGLDDAKHLIKQPKDSTAIKQLMNIAISYVLHDKKTRDILDIVINNARKNARTGVIDTEYL